MALKVSPHEITLPDFLAAARRGFESMWHVGPMAGLEMHPMDGADRMAYLKDQAGIGFCNITKCCSEVCRCGTGTEAGICYCR